MEIEKSNSLPSLPSVPAKLPEVVSNATEPLFEGQQQRHLPANYTAGDARKQALACRSASEALLAPTMRQLAAHFPGGEDQVVTEVAVIVEQGMEAFGANRRMSVPQVAMFSREIAHMYPHESLADINAFMNGAAMSKYDDGEFYGNVDIPRLAKWWRAYLEEKSEARERTSREAASAARREAEFVIGSIPGLAEAVSKAALDNKERLHQDARRRRMARLGGQFKIMTDQDLRDAYVKYKDADTRSVILQEAASRGLLSAAMNEAIRRGEEEARAEAQHLTDHPEELPEIPETPSTQVA